MLLVKKLIAFNHPPEAGMFVLKPITMRLPGLKFLLEDLLAAKHLAEQPMSRVETGDVAITFAHIALIAPDFRSVDLGFGIVDLNMAGSCLYTNQADESHKTDGDSYANTHRNR